MSYKEICENCKGNGYVKVNKNVHQCWACESEGEHRFTQAEVDEFIYNTYYRKRLQ